MSAGGISRTNSNNVSANSNIATKFEPRGNNDVSFSKAVSGGEFACYRDSASSKIWHWGWQGKDASGKPVSLTGEVTLSGKFTEKELTNGSTLKNKFEEARKAGAKPVIKLALSKTPKLSLPNPSYSIPSSPLCGFRTGNTSNPYASSYAPIVNPTQSPTTQYQLKAETLLKRADAALSNFDAKPSDMELRRMLNHVTAEMNSLVCSINAQKVKPETMQALSSQLVKAQGRLNPKLSALDNAAAGYYDGAARPVQWTAEQAEKTKLVGVSHAGKFISDGIKHDRNNLKAIGADPKKISYQAGLAFGDNLSQTAIIMATGGVGGLAKTEKGVKILANTSSVVFKGTKIASKAGKGIATVATKIPGATHAVKAGRGVATVVKKIPGAKHAVKAGAAVSNFSVNTAKLTGKILIHPTTHTAIDRTAIGYLGYNVTNHALNKDLVGLSGDLGSFPFVTEIAANMAKKIKKPPYQIVSNKLQSTSNKRAVATNNIVPVKSKSTTIKPVTPKKPEILVPKSSYSKNPSSTTVTLERLEDVKLREKELATLSGRNVTAVNQEGLRQLVAKAEREIVELAGKIIKMTKDEWKNEGLKKQLENKKRLIEYSSNRDATLALAHIMKMEEN
jgi:hypothetical protein